MNQEKITKPTSGYIMLLLAIVLIPTGVILLSQKLLILGIPLLILGVATSSGFFFINPNGSVVLTLFGAYKGTVKANGFFWANPFYTKKKVSLRARNFDSDRVKVNDKLGNPIMISVILVWKVSDTFKAAFEVDDYQHFVRV